jgi:hypothetical protein
VFSLHEIRVMRGPPVILKALNDEHIVWKFMKLTLLLKELRLLVVDFFTVWLFTIYLSHSGHTVDKYAKIHFLAKMPK